MGKNDNIFIRLQIEKDGNSGNLMLGIYFDKNAPNFSTEKDILNWSPTFEEINFIVETFEMVSKQSGKNYGYNYSMKNNKTSFQSENKREEQPEENIERDINAVEPIKADNTTEENAPAPDIEHEEPKEKIFVQAKEETIDEALTRNKGEPVEEFMIEADEKTIIDKVLKQKLKNKK